MKLIKTPKGTKPVTEKVEISKETKPETAKVEKIDGILANVVKKVIQTSKGPEKEI